MSFPIKNSLTDDVQGHSGVHPGIRLRLGAMIEARKIAPGEAMRTYSKLADDFFKDVPQKAELIRMVYGRGVERLSEQYLAGDH